MRLNILASKSPRRKDLLNQIGFKFSIVDSNFKEYHNNDIPPEALAETLAREKALKVAKSTQHSPFTLTPALSYISTKTLHAT